MNDDQKKIQMYAAALELIETPVSIGDKNNHAIFQNIAFKQLFGQDFENDRTHLSESIFQDPFLQQKIVAHLSSNLEWHGDAIMKDSWEQAVPVELKIDAIIDDDDHAMAFVARYIDISKRDKIERESLIQKESLSTLRSISLGMFHRLDLLSLLNAIIQRAAKLTGIPNGFLYLFDPETKKLVVRAACGMMEKSVGFEVKPGIGFAGTVFKTGDPLILKNYQEWENRLENDFTDNICAIVCIPLISGSKIEGVIGLCHDAPEQEIAPDIVHILEEFAAIAQIAIDNAKLFDSMKSELEKRIQLEKDRKQMEYRINQSQRMESIGTLAGGIAHDFNNILASIIGFTQIAHSEAENGSMLKQDLNEIYQASLRAKDLVSQILTFARQSDEKVHPIRISLVAKEVLKFIRATIPTTIAIRQDIKSGAKVTADPSQVYQIFLNLFTNSAQAMGNREGTLSISIEEQNIDSQSPSLDPGHYLCIKISDTGCGIPEKILPHIFEPYFTTKEAGEGTGLGLSVVHGAVKSMNGEIFVKSKCQEGTTFSLFLPVTETDDPLAEPEKEKDFIAQGRQEHILFVDDEQPIIQVGRRLLESHNFKVTAMDDSPSALDLFKKNPASFQAVVTDMTMPGMTGEILAKNIKELRPDIPVILCTGHHKNISDNVFQKSGIDFICKKPFSKQLLGEIVRKAIDQFTA